ncbi:DUF305 domain-containing protein [Micromonospora globbae]|uniref:DUF305 domain-containing protein n=1 Tax=Micromonospora globbae TaxID=1894969 RepID=UPI00341FA651
MRTTAASSALVAVALLVSGCAHAGPAARPPTATTGNAASPAGTAGPGGTRGAAAFNGTDVAWLQLHVAMAERLLPALDLVPARTTDPAWRRLAAQVAATHRADLTRARGLLAGSGAPATNPHEGHDMPGMVTAEQLAELRSASVAALHRLLAQHLRAHLTQAVRVAAAEQRSGAHPAVTALAAAVVRNGTAALARLDRLDPPPASAGAR